ncbi:phospholipase D-like domain-containing protein [Cetobacterium sp. SF1]|uniref:phospholipase D-like domain-containing protein n=1 Tax=Cetobacterium sp. SF1 TaxID=3417654 RepID=UPI003CF470A0
MNLYPKLEAKASDYTTVKFGQGVGEDILSFMNKAENYIYIISPYISVDMVKKLKELKKLKPKLDIKVIFSDEENFLENYRYQNVFSELINYSWKEDKEKKENNLNMIRLEEKKLKNIKWMIFSGLIISILLTIILKKITYFNFPVYLMCMPIYLMSLYFFRNQRNKTLEKIKNIENDKTYFAEFINLLNYKCIKCWDDKETKEIFPHIKLYLMDFTSSSGKLTEKAYWGSANFTSNGFNHNLESITETIDYNLIPKFKTYFDEMYNYNFKLHSSNYIGKILFGKRILKKF